MPMCVRSIKVSGDDFYPAEMHPRLINQVQLPSMRRVAPAAGLGWVVTEPATMTVSLFDHDLRPMARTAVPLDNPQVEASATHGFLAVGDRHEIAVLDHAGTLRWRSTWDRVAGRAPDRKVSFHLDGNDILWIRLADTRELMAVYAPTGDEIHRVPVPGPEAAWFLHRPTDAWTGLALLQPDPSPGALISLTDGRIAVRALSGLDLAGFNPAGDRYLTMTLDGFLSVRDIDTEAILANRHIDDMVDIPPDVAGWRLTDWAVFVTDELILISVVSTDLPDDAEEHLLLSARSLRCRSRLRYPGQHAPGSIYGAERQGRWLTRHHHDNVLRLWHLANPLDDEPLPGQIALL
ncbi:hypothetical protein GCM10010170_100400 [Dactylosporangium salmoneum]|uniref:Uncharacterized protein n=1 Tax=Dactylosporangium salmoneum TaxID=53361 RepID=A0ABN3HVN3_9ACTN